MSRLRFALRLGLPSLVLLLAAFLFLAQPVGAHIPAAQAPGAPHLTPTVSPTSTPCTGWAVVASDNVPSLDNYLYGVSALSANDIWAVGIYFTADGYARTLTEHWDGTAWTVVPSANPGTNNNSLFGVTAIAPNDVWAVGWYSNTNIQQPLTMHWDGTTWTQVDVANPGPGREVLLGIDAVATNDIWAVGIGCNRALCDQRLPLALHWDGTAWSFVSTPAPATYDHEFNGVVALASNDVWAVGQACTQNGCAASDTLVEHWNGTAWTVVSSPNTGQALNTLNAVDARSSSDIWAVGQSCSNGNCDSVQSLTEHWNGTAWSIVSSPNPGSVDTHLNAVAIGAADDAWAGGSYTSDGTNFSNALFHWNGSTWSVVPGTNPGAVDNDLRGMAALSQND